MSLQRDQFRSLIKETLIEMDMYSDSAVELLMLTAAVESNFGEYLRQIKGPAKGYFQCEPVTHNDIMDRWLNTRPDVKAKVEKFAEKYLDGAELGKLSAKTMEYNIKYAILVARLFYLRVKEPLPKATDVNALAAYWKKYYNTHLGAGVVAKAVDKYRYYCES